MLAGVWTECVHAKLLQSCPTHCDPLDCSLPGSSVHGILQAKYWSGLPCLPPGDLPDPGIEPESLTFPAVASGFFTTSRTTKWGPTVIAGEGDAEHAAAGRLLGVRGLGRLQKLQGGGSEVTAAALGAHPRASAGEVPGPAPGPATHQLGALVRAVAGEDEGRLLRGDGHHGRVRQAQLHDARVEAPQRSRVVQADARGVAPALGEEGRR